MRADKQRDLLDGARRVFARDGYGRASIQSLAAEAGVSTRTIYNQYGNKQELFRAVILDSATREADRQVARVRQFLGQVTDIRSDLIAFGMAWSTTDPASEMHFTMIRQIRADSAHIDPDVLAAWRRAGPERVRAEIGDHLVALSRQGLLRVSDGALAALHLVSLTAGVVSTTTTSGDAEALVAAGVDVFLSAYGATDSADCPR